MTLDLMERLGTVNERRDRGGSQGQWTEEAWYSLGGNGSINKMGEG